jgi:hypothetical protein
VLDNKNWTQQLPTGTFIRRNSVSAESFIPGQRSSRTLLTSDYPKTAAQRRRLLRVLEQVFLFSSLDQEHYLQVADAFVEEVLANEGTEVCMRPSVCSPRTWWYSKEKVNRWCQVIKQGDDGDLVITSTLSKKGVSTSTSSMHPHLETTIANGKRKARLALETTLASLARPVVQCAPRGNCGIGRTGMCPVGARRRVIPSNYCRVQFCQTAITRKLP